MKEEATQYNTRAEWFEARKGGLGASDASALLGLNRWKSALELYAEKVGLDPDDDEPAEHVEWGNLLEPILVNRYREVTGRAAQHMQNLIWRHPEHEWMLGSPDGAVSAPEHSGEGVLEIKTASAYKAQEWDSEPPIEYLIQVQHLMSVMSLGWASFAVLIGGQKFLWCDVERNDRFISMLIAKEQEFWDRIQNQDPPLPDASDSATKAITALFPAGEEGKAVRLPAEAVEWDRKREEIRASIKRLESEEKQYANNIRFAIGDATVGILADGTQYSYKTVNRKAYTKTVEASSYRTLRRLKQGDN